MAALTSGEIRRSMNNAGVAFTARSGLRRFHPRLATLTLIVTLGILALTAGLFFILPRTADAAFSRLISHTHAPAGILQPGRPRRDRRDQEHLPRRDARPHVGSRSRRRNGAAAR